MGGSDGPSDFFAGLRCQAFAGSVLTTAIS